MAGDRRPSGLAGTGETLWKGIAARIRGDVPVDAVRHLTPTGENVYNLLERANDRLLELEIKGHHLWEVDPATQAFLACTWAAFVFYTIADQIVEAAVGDDGERRRFLSSDTFSMVQSLISRAEEWVVRAEEAHHSSGFQPPAGMPVRLPLDRMPSRVSAFYLHGLIEAMRIVQTHAEELLARIESHPVSHRRRDEMDQLKRVHAAASTRARHIDQMALQGVPEAMEASLAREVVVVLQAFCHLGQLAVVPALINRYIRHSSVLTDLEMPVLAAPASHGHRIGNELLVGINAILIILTLIPVSLAPFTRTHLGIIGVWIVMALFALGLTFAGAYDRHRLWIAAAISTTFLALSGAVSLLPP